MRGVIFTGGGMPDFDVIKPWLEPYDFVIAADSGLLGAERAHIRPDLIMGDMDSLGDISLLERYPPEKKIIYVRDKDYSDTELAMAAMIERDISDITLVGGDGGRMDHFFALRLLFERKLVPSLWIGSESVVVALGPGAVSTAVRVSGLDAEDPVSIFAAASGHHACRGKGFHWPPDLLDWDNGALSLSNRTDTGTIELEASQGRFLLIVPYRNGIHITRS